MNKFPILSYFLFSCFLIHAAPLVVGITDPTPVEYEGVWDGNYAEGVRKAGHVPLMICFDDDTNRLAMAISRVDLLLLTGGSDIEPWRYGAKPSPKLKKTNPPRDTFEYILLDLARKRGIPIVAICRGCQMLNVFFGGTLWQDLPSEKGTDIHGDGKPAHEIDVDASSRLALVLGAGKQMVNTYHHQAVKDVAPGFRVTARAMDGVVEAIEGVDYPAIGVQFHPEVMANKSAAKALKSIYREDMVRLFEKLEILARPKVAAGPKILEHPFGTACRAWVADGVTYLEILNKTARNISGTVTLNEIYEKVMRVSGEGTAEIDGRWIEVELPANDVLSLKLGK